LLEIHDGLKDDLLAIAIRVHLLLVVSLEAIFDKGDFLFGLADASLLVQQEGVPILQSILCPSLEVVDNLRPLLAAVVVLDQSQQLHILRSKPGSLL
jgi:hypothetical protein